MGEHAAAPRRMETLLVRHVARGSAEQSGVVAGVG
jgi:hypothetical protein